MNTFAKVSVFVLLILSAGFLVSQMILQHKREQWYKLSQTYLDDLGRTTNELETKTKELEDLKVQYDKALTTLEGKIGAQEEAISNLKDEITALATEKSKLSDQVSQMAVTVEKLGEVNESKEKQIEERRKELAGLREELNTKVAELTDSAAQTKDQQGQIDELKGTIDGLQKKTESIKEDRDQLSLIISELIDMGVHIPGQDVTAVDGNVVRVDSELGLAVINRGRQDGVKLNYPFTVFRDAQFVARVIVHAMDENVCVAHVSPGMAAEGLQIEVGDRATTRIR